MRRSKPSLGFTLIEVLIAMTLLSVMVALLFGSMRISAESWQKGEDKITEVNDIAVVYQFFRNHLSTAKPLWDNFSEDNEIFSFSGKSQEVRFVSSFPASANKAGLQQFEVKLMKDREEQFVQVSITPFYPAAKHEEWRKEEVTLLRHVVSFSINYFALDENENKGVWMEDWTDRDVLPKLVKIQVETENDSFWPEMIVELKSEPRSNNGDDLSSLPDDEDTNTIDESDTLDEE